MAACKQIDNWQEGRSLVECNRYMMEHDIADITFKLEYKNKHRSANAVNVRALKTLLLARSSVFYAMFCGELQEQSQVITITDVEPGAFKELIRFIYTDDVHLTADNVLAVLYASKKYMVSTLTTKCTEYLENQLNADTALDLLEQSIFFSVKDLTSKCLETIQTESSKVLSSGGFTNLSKAAIHEILKSDYMNASELEVFKACVKWAKSQCRKTEQPVNATNMRAVLANDLFLIRFPAMSVKEFNDEVVPHELLTYQEGFKLLRCLTSEGHVDISPFIANPRGNHLGPHLLLYKGTFQKTQWAPNQRHPATVYCTLSKAITLSKVFINCVNADQSFMSSYSLQVSQGGRRLGRVNINQPTVVHDETTCPYIACDVGNISVSAGIFELTTSFVWGQRSRVFVKVQQMQSNLPAVINYKDRYISIDCQAAGENIILGFEYSLDI